MDTPIDDGGSAFPQVNGGGMTLREYFAGQALMGQIANANWNKLSLELQGISEDKHCAVAAFVAVCYADTLIAELKKGQ